MIVVYNLCKFCKDVAISCFSEFTQQPKMFHEHEGQQYELEQRQMKQVEVSQTLSMTNPETFYESDCELSKGIVKMLYEDLLGDES